MAGHRYVREVIRQSFHYLVTDYGFTCPLGRPSDGVRPHVYYRKQGWTISISATPQTRKLILRLISPDGEAAMLRHYFRVLNPNYGSVFRDDRSLRDRILYHADFLRTNAFDLISGDEDAFARVFALIEIVRQQKVKE